MISASFTFKVRVKYKDRTTGKVVESINQNYLSPLQVISWYWSETDAGARVLSVFTNGSSVDKDGSIRPGRTFTFPERDGERFVNHMEDFLTLMISGGSPQQQQTTQPRRERTDHRGRRPIDTVESEEVIESEDGAVDPVAVFET